MGRAGTLQEIRAMRFEAILSRHERGELAQESSDDEFVTVRWVPGRIVGVARPLQVGAERAATRSKMGNGALTTGDGASRHRLVRRG